MGSVHVHVHNKAKNKDVKTKACLAHIIISLMFSVMEVFVSLPLQLTIHDDRAIGVNNNNGVTVKNCIGSEIDRMLGINGGVL